MLGRGFVAVRLAFAGTSAFIKELRPSSSTTLAMFPLEFCANNGAKNDAAKIAQKASVALRNHRQFVARLSIHHASAVRHTLCSSSSHTAAIILECLVAVNATSVLCALDLSVGMPLSRWKLRPAPLEIGRPKHPRERHLCPIPRVQRDESPDWRRLMEPHCTGTQQHQCPSSL